MDVYINGGLYLKRNLESISKEELMKYGFLGMTDNIEMYTPFFEKQSYIHQLLITNDGPCVRFRNYFGNLSSFYPISYDNLENYYIPLEKFLENSSYIGKEAIIKVEDTNLFPNEITIDKDYLDVLVLYNGDHHILCINTSDIDAVFSKRIPLVIVDKSQIKSINYVGSQTDRYSDYKKLYHDLYMEIYNNTKNMNDKNKGK